MEKRKDIDMLRFYGGDIHQKNKEGEYVITNNLVNPKNKEDMLWGDRDAYRTLNALLFEGIENEKERIYKEKRKLNPVFIELIENTLDIYRGIFAVMCRKKENQLSVSKVKRVDRKASLMAYLKCHTESFVSCTKGECENWDSRECYFWYTGIRSQSRRRSHSARYSVDRFRWDW